MLQLTIDTSKVIKALKEYQTQGHGVAWFTNYNGGTSLNALTVDEDPQDLQAVKIGLSSCDFENFATNIAELLNALDGSGPVTVLSYSDSLLTVGNTTLETFNENF